MRIRSFGQRPRPWLAAALGLLCIAESACAHLNTSDMHVALSRPPIHVKGNCHQPSWPCSPEDWHAACSAVFPETPGFFVLSLYFFVAGDCAVCSANHPCPSEPCILRNSNPVPGADILGEGRTSALTVLSCPCSPMLTHSGSYGTFGLISLPHPSLSSHRPTRSPRPSRAPRKRMTSIPRSPRRHHGLRSVRRRSRRRSCLTRSRHSCPRRRPRHCRV